MPPLLRPGTIAPSWPSSGACPRRRGRCCFPRLQRQYQVTGCVCSEMDICLTVCIQRLPGCLRGSISQTKIAGVLAWARAVVFPSLWPEPGGIVGLDAQLFGVPMASFAVGAALDWPETELFRPGDSKAMADWLASQPPSFKPRDADVIAGRQSAYWERVGQRASQALEAFCKTGRFPPLDLSAVTADLNWALAHNAWPVSK